MTDNLLKSQAFKLKGRLYTLTVMHLLDIDHDRFKAQIADVVQQAPRLFDKTPVVLDCTALEQDTLDLQFICQTMKEHGLIPVAIQGGSPVLDLIANCNGLAILNSTSVPEKNKSRKHKNDTSEPKATKSLIVNTPVRSGQQVVSKGSDLVITASVSHGAELLADGHIHVYGALRGRALAGIAGDKEARIFCQSLDAELVSIAGFYRLSDAIEPLACPCQIYLQDDHIQIEPL